MPRKPHRKPNPSATELSGSKVNDASFNCNFSRLSLKSSKSSLSIGNVEVPQKAFLEVLKLND